MDAVDTATTRDAPGTAAGDVFGTALRELVREEVATAVRAALADARQDEYLSTSAAARLASVAQGTVRRWIREGRLEALGAGREIRLRRTDVEALMRGGRGYGRRTAKPIGSPEALAVQDFASVWHGKKRSKKSARP